MKLVFFLSSLLLVSWSPQKMKTLNGTWTLVCFSESNTDFHDCNPESLSEKSITLEFADSDGMGKIKGHTTSNNVFGNYQISGENQMKVTSFGGTKIVENGWGNQFWTTISQSSSFEFKADSLFIYYDNNLKIMKFIRTINE